MKIINLLPEEEAKELKLEVASHQLTRFFAIVASSLLVLFILAFGAKFFLKNEIGKDNNLIEDLQKQLSSANNQALEKQVVTLNGQIKTIKIIDQQHYYWSKALVELGNMSPSDFHLDTVTLDRGSGLITVSGVSDSRSSVITFWSNVKKSQYFSNINFPLTNLEEPSDTHFSFTFNINPDTIKTNE